MIDSIKLLIQKTTYNLNHNFIKLYLESISSKVKKQFNNNIERKLESLNFFFYIGSKLNF